MVYTANIPLSTDNPSQSQGQIQGNFNSINTAFNLNHGHFDVVGEEGKHLFMQMPVQASAPTTLVNEGALYTRTSTLTGVTELVYGRQSNGDQIEFTGSLNAANGWTRLPSGILLKWGTSSANGIQVLNYPVGATIPVFVNVFQAFVTTLDSSVTPNTFAYLNAFNGVGITVHGTNRTTLSNTIATYTYLVIGI